MKIIYITTEERAVNYRWEKGCDTINKEIVFLSPEQAISLSKERNYVFPNIRLYEGVVLVRHPYKRNHYVKLDEMEKTYLQDLVNDFFTISNHLGAKRLKIERKHMKEASEINSGSMGVSVSNVVDAKGTMKKSMTTKQGFELVREETFRHNTLNVTQFQEIRKRAEDEGYLNNSAIKYFFDNITPNGPQIGSQSFDLIVTNEIEETFDAVASLHIAKIFNLDAKYETAMSRSEKIELHIQLDFEDYKKEPGKDIADVTNELS